MLVTVAHGTRTPRGNDVARAITEAAAARLGVRGVTSFVEIAEPLLADVMAGLDNAAPAAKRAVTVVPLLLSTGYHVRSDVPEAVARAPFPVRLAGALGPDPLLAAVQVARLREAGATSGQRVVFVATGSSDPAATGDHETAVAHLARAWDGPVELATMSGHGPRPTDVVRRGDAVSPYLLAPGFFSDRLAQQMGPDVLVADVLGAHDQIIDLVAERFRGAPTPGAPGCADAP